MRLDLVNAQGQLLGSPGQGLQCKNIDELLKREPGFQKNAKIQIRLKCAHSPVLLTSLHSQLAHQTYLVDRVALELAAPIRIRSQIHAASINTYAVLVH